MIPGLLKGFFVGVIKNPVKSLLVVSVLAGVIMFGLWQGAKLDDTERQLDQARQEKIEAEKRSERLQDDIEDLKKRHQILIEKNRTINAELEQSRDSIETWREHYQDAIENPETDTQRINQYFNNLLNEFECATGGCDEN